MKESLKIKLQQMYERFQEISQSLADASTISDAERLKQLSKEYSQLKDLADGYEQYQNACQSIASLEELANHDDQELISLAQEELTTTRATLITLEEALQHLLIPKEEADERNIYLEIRAGTGGDEAAIFAGDLYRMYYRYAENQGWQIEIMSAHPSEHGGYKEIISQIKGHQVYGQLKFESGVHRVQRVPETEAQGRVHTSACTVAVLPELEEIHAIDISPDELKIDTYRASGAGGQHVNKTDSAIRITHLPSGLVIECQDERSQHKNRAKAMALLKARLLDAEQSKQQQHLAQTRKLLVGSGDRSERIRTYNFPQGRLTDHRINLTLYQLPEVMTGNLSPIIDALKREHYAELLAEVAAVD